MTAMGTTDNAKQRSISLVRLGLITAGVRLQDNVVYLQEIFQRHEGFVGSLDNIALQERMGEVSHIENVAEDGRPALLAQVQSHRLHPYTDLLIGQILVNLHGKRLPNQLSVSINLDGLLLLVLIGFHIIPSRRGLNPSSFTQGFSAIVLDRLGNDGIGMVRHQQLYSL